MQGYLSATNLAMSVIATTISKQKHSADISRTVLSTNSKPVMYSSVLIILPSVVRYSVQFEVPCQDTGSLLPTLLYKNQVL